jgi:hypothetical protein
VIWEGCLIAFSCSTLESLYDINICKHSPTKSAVVGHTGYKKIHGEDSFLRILQWFSYSRNSPLFMETECSLPCSQEHANGLYSVLDQYNPEPSTLFPQDQFNIILPPTLRSSKWSLNLGLSNKKLLNIIHLPHAPYMPGHHILLDLIMWIGFTCFRIGTIGGLSWR